MVHLYTFLFELQRCNSELVHPRSPGRDRTYVHEDQNLAGIPATHRGKNLRGGEDSASTQLIRIIFRIPHVLRYSSTHHDIRSVSTSDDDRCWKRFALDPPRIETFGTDLELAFRIEVVRRLSTQYAHKYPMWESNPLSPL